MILKPKRIIKKRLWLITLFMIYSMISIAQLPNYFTNEVIVSGLKKVEGVVFDHNKRMYAWEKNGRIVIVDSNGVVLPAALLNITPEVGSWTDHGLNGLVLDPDFKNNGYFYVSYVVDRHHLLYYGTPTYDKDSDEFFNATIARVTRYTADSATGFTTLVPNSRKILIGTTRQNGIPVTHRSHGACAMVFGRDGTLLVGTGDGAAYGDPDSGANVLTYAPQALLDSIITPAEDVGAYRSQMITSMNGKILRIDPKNGKGIPSNPYYDPSNAYSAQSRMYVLGLRNPYTISLKPGTGSTNPADGNPGTIYIGDVGWDTWEELDVADRAKLNFGWPIFEGLNYNSTYYGMRKANQQAPNPLFGMGGCTKQFFDFHDLLMQETLDTTKKLRNPCDTSIVIPDSILTFMHARPTLEFRHHYDSTNVGIFVGNNAAIISVDDSLSPCPGEPFGGDCIIDGMFYTGNNFPPEYKGKYFFGEFEDEWIRALSLDTANKPFGVEPFGESLGFITHITENPFDGSLIYVKYPDEIHRIRYIYDPLVWPAAIATADTTNGGDTLTVNFDGSSSFSPVGLSLTYSWNFGDSTTSTMVNPQHTFATTPGNVTSYTVILTVTDDSSHSATDTIVIWLNNSPPVVDITSFNDGDLFNMSFNSTIPLQANVFDAEQDSTQLTYAWSVKLHNNSGISLVKKDNNKNSNFTTTPQYCGAPIPYYEATLTVTDIYGAKGSDAKKLYPDCNAPVAQIGSMDTICQNTAVQFYDSTAHFPGTWLWTFNGGNPASSTLQTPTVSYPATGTFIVGLKVSNSFGIDSAETTIYVISSPVVNLGVDNSICDGNSIILDAGNAGYAFLWSNGSTMQTITVSTQGTYTVIVTNTEGCTASDDIQVTIYPLPNVIALAPNDSLCLQAGNVPLSGTPAGGTFTGNGVSGTNFNTTTAGLGLHSVIYTYTDSVGCTGSDTIQLWVDACLGIAGITKSGIELFPNPAHEKLYIRTPKAGVSFTINMYTPSGKEIYSTSAITSNKDTEISLDRIASGIYFVEIIMNDHIWYYKFVKQ